MKSASGEDIMGTLSDIGIQEEEQPVEQTKEKTRREKVYDLIDGERGYQLRRWGVMGADGNMVDPPKTVGEYLVVMKHFMDRAIDDWATTAGDSLALEQVRKVAALGVACMEHHETPPRIERMVENLRSGQIT